VYMQCPIGTIEINLLNFVVKRTMFKIFCTYPNDIVQSCQLYFNFPDMSLVLTVRTKMFPMTFDVQYV